MTTKERIIILRLIEKAEKQPEFAKKLVIEAASGKNLRIKDFDPRGLTVM